MTKPSICYFGFLGGGRSIGKVGHYLVSHLLSRSWQVYFRPCETDYMAGRWSAEIKKLIIDHPEKLEIDLGITFCSILDPWHGKFARRTTAWIYHELNSIPAKTAASINLNDHVYVISSFIKRTFAAHGVVAPMSVLGLGFDPKYYRQVPRKKEKEFVFLCVAENTPRKNLPVLVQCFEKAFAGRNDVRLVLKVGLHGEGDLRQHITRPDQVTILAKQLGGEAKLAALYRRVHCFVLPTRAEGFGLPILEAMATGLPVIVTNYGGQLDFCSEQNAFLIQSRGLVDCDPSCFPYLESQWADPDPDHLIHLLRHVFDNYESALALGDIGCRAAREKWTWEKQLGALTIPGEKSP